MGILEIVKIGLFEIDHIIHNVINTILCVIIHMFTLPKKYIIYTTPCYCETNIGVKFGESLARGECPFSAFLTFNRWPYYGILSSTQCELPVRGSGLFDNKDFWSPFPKLFICSVVFHSAQT